MSSNTSRTGGVAIPAVAAAALYLRPKNAAKAGWASKVDRQSGEPAADAEPPVAPSSSQSAEETRRA